MCLVSNPEMSMAVVSEESCALVNLAKMPLFFNPSTCSCCEIKTTTYIAMDVNIHYLVAIECAENEDVLTTFVQTWS